MAWLERLCNAVLRGAVYILERLEEVGWADLGVRVWTWRWCDGVCCQGCDPLTSVLIRTASRTSSDRRSARTVCRTLDSVFGSMLPLSDQLTTPHT